ncbi:hypothetical protein MHO82_05710 [Vibrio sp. Of7-15]|uniref:hypothetical protein n=1 Tax=Vibrio sp. Of7-15 TaxID=2724879 RepID=UPI001EF1885D|nr:hypothetical protein [Vibrio sp. Of7-15]MCG7496349.1 hypothetical protein [Vibrio sp. Of7-15]
MSNKHLDKEFLLGGSIEKALSGDYELSPVKVLQEAWKNTLRYFISFFPAIMALLLAQLALFLFALKLQLGDPFVLFEALQGKGDLTEAMLNAVWIANFSSEVLSAPLYAGVSLMAMSHAAGLPSKPRHLMKGLPFAVAVTIATMVASSVQGMANLIFPLLSLYLTMALGMGTLLICEKRVPPLQALMLSFRATYKKIIPLTAIYMFLLIMFALSFTVFGLGLIIVLPFFFNVKGVIYRNMFGVSLKITTKIEGDDDNDNDHQVFNA